MDNGSENNWLSPVCQLAVKSKNYNKKAVSCLGQNLLRVSVKRLTVSLSPLLLSDKGRKSFSNTIPSAQEPAVSAFNYPIETCHECLISHTLTLTPSIKLVKK